MRTGSSLCWIRVEFLHNTSSYASADEVATLRFVAGVAPGTPLRRHARYGTAWGVTATAAATDPAVRPLRQQYGNGAGPESKKVSRR